VSKLELHGFKMGGTRLKFTLQKPPMFFKESEPELEVFFKKKNQTTLVFEFYNNS
jgi:hypothetical protein